MNQEINDKRYYHINRKNGDSSFSQMRVGDTYLFSRDCYNPFYNFYEKLPEITSIQIPQFGGGSGIPSVISLSFLDGMVQNYIGLPQRVYDIAQEYNKLARELMLEKVRCEKFPTAPSRQNCVFLFDPKDLQEWKKTLGLIENQYQILQVIAKGNAIRVDSNYLPQGIEAISEWESKAFKYWNGELSQNPLTEVLLEGEITVECIME